MSAALIAAGIIGWGVVSVGLGLLLGAWMDSCARHDEKDDDQ